MQQTCRKVRSEAEVCNEPCSREKRRTPNTVFSSHFRWWPGKGGRGMKRYKTCSQQGDGKEMRFTAQPGACVHESTRHFIIISIQLSHDLTWTASGRPKSTQPTAHLCLRLRTTTCPPYHRYLQHVQTVPLEAPFSYYGSPKSPRK